MYRWWACRACSRRSRRQLQRQIGEPRVVEVGEVPAARDPAVEAAELVDADGGRDVVHGELVAGLGHVVVGGSDVTVARP